MKSRGTPCPIGFKYTYSIEEGSDGKKWIACALVRDSGHAIWNRTLNVHYKEDRYEQERALSTSY